MPTEGITRRHRRRGRSTRGAHSNPVAFRSLPRRVAALLCFGRFLFCVCVSGGETGRKPAPGTASIPPLSVSPLRGPQRCDARRRCGFAAWVSGRSRVLCCRSGVVPVNHRLLDCPAGVFCFGVALQGRACPLPRGHPSWLEHCVAGQKTSHPAFVPEFKSAFQRGESFCHGELCFTNPELHSAL